jgi:hypothetical protein
MDAGSSTARMIVGVDQHCHRKADAHLFHVEDRHQRNTAKTPTITSAALVTTPPSC